MSLPCRELDLSQYVDGEQDTPPKYRLVAVCNHVGGLESGHYTAHARNKLDGRWRLFNDTQVQLVDSVEEVVSPYAYILLYERITEWEDLKTEAFMEAIIEPEPMGEQPEMEKGQSTAPLRVEIPSCDETVANNPETMLESPLIGKENECLQMFLSKQDQSSLKLAHIVENL